MKNKEKILPTHKPIKVVSRSSNLALKQVEEVFSFLPDVNYELIKLQSYGDKHKEISLLTNTAADFFTRELDDALLSGKADIAIHSAKDLPYPLPEGLEILALFEAFDKTDSLVSAKNLKLSELPKGSKVGTSSQTRKKELLAIRPDLQIVSIRGTIEERLAQVNKGSIDALIVATCALKRLGIGSRITEVLPFETHPLQGHLAVVAKTGGKYKSLFKKLDIRKKYGTVHLVGFGPGNPDLLTIKAVKLLKKANVIFHDDLIDSAFLNRFKAEKVYVGKRKDKHSFEQDEINKLLYYAAIECKTVIRLKGGDPMVFAHGGEEVEYLQERLVHVEVTPGISSGIAVSSLTKIPLTHRGISSSVSFISGHSSSVPVPSTDTLVYYMGASNIKNIANKAIETGWELNTPVALVHNVSLPNQTEFYSTLKELATSETKYPTPLIIVIGNVVRLKHNKAELLEKPTVLVTGSTINGYGKLGNVIHQPLIEIKPLQSFEGLKQSIKRLSDYDWLIFTSQFAVKHFFDALHYFNKDARNLATSHIASIGKTTTEALKQHGIIPDIQSVDESSEGLVNLFKSKKNTDKKILLPRSDIALSILPEGLRKLGNKVDTLPVYHNTLPENAKPVDLEKVNYITFASPSGVTNFLKIYDQIPENIGLIAQGKVTAQTLKEAGFTEDKIMIK